MISVQLSSLLAFLAVMIGVLLTTTSEPAQALGPWSKHVVQVYDGGTRMVCDVTNHRPKINEHSGVTLFRSATRDEVFRSLKGDVDIMEIRHRMSNEKALEQYCTKTRRPQDRE